MGKDDRSRQLQHTIEDNVYIDKRTLSFVYKDGSGESQLGTMIHQAYTIRNAVRYQKPLRYSLAIVSVLIVLSVVVEESTYDLGRDVDVASLLIRIAILLPCVIFILLFTLTKTYRNKPDLIGLPGAVVCAGAVGYLILDEIGTR